MFFVVFSFIILEFSCLQADTLEFYEIEHQALVDFYHSTHGPNWIRQDNWLSDNVPYCKWHGVICDEENRVIEIQLYDNGLEGPLPESIGNLEKLKTLYLSFNNIKRSDSLHPRCFQPPSRKRVVKG